MSKLELDDPARVIGPKETVYDRAIAPLVTQILEICQAHNINMSAVFSLDEDLYCRSIIALDLDDQGHDVVVRCDRLAQRLTSPAIVTHTIVTRPAT